MERTITKRRRTYLSLQPALYHELELRARQWNGSLSGYIESLLMSTLYEEPNEMTKAAIEDSIQGRSAGVVDLSSLDAFKRSVGL